MKKIMLLTSLAIYTISFSVLAGSSDIFLMDQSTMDMKFRNLNQLENIVNQYDEIMLSQMKAIDKPIASNMKPDDAVKNIITTLSLLNNCLPLRSTAFLLDTGCCSPCTNMTNFH